MAEERVQRKLTTILGADVVGYSRLMRADEETTLKTLTEYREVINGLIARHGGRVFSTGGDSVFAEFGSAVEAVRCAISFQEEISSRNTVLADDRKLVFRIGINVGDVMVSDGKLYGDGVNVAARLEGLADPGGICVSGSVFEQIKHKLSVGFDDMGPQQVKNIAEPVSTYRLVPGQVSVTTKVAPKLTPVRNWRLPAAAVAVAVVIAAGILAVWRPWEPEVVRASVERMAFQLPDKPSIAVLPFANLSGDPDQEYLSDSITEDIITALSRLPELFVIARNSTFTYKGKAVKVQDVSETLGVRYVLEGSVQKSGERLRITAQLVDAVSGHHVWGERYEQTLNDLFTLQDEITLNVISNLHVELSPYGRANLAKRGTTNLRAWLLRAQSMEYIYRFTKEDNIRARQMIEEAIELDPNYAYAYVLLAWRYWQDARNQWTDDPEAAFNKAKELAEKALSLDELNPNAYILLAGIHIFNRAYDEAVASAERAINLGPNNSEAFAILGWALNSSMQPEKAIPHIKKAMRLGPYYPNWFLRELADSYMFAKRHAEAIAAYTQFLARDPGEQYAAIVHCELAAIYDELGDKDKAHAEIVKAVATDASVTISFLRTHSLVKDEAYRERKLATLRRLGLPE